MGRGPLEAELARTADRLVGGPDAVLVIDDTSLPKKGSHSVGVAPQYASMLGKRANCQTLVSLTLARDEVPVALGLRLFLPESWTRDGERMVAAGVPEPFQASRSKPQTALQKIDRARAQGVRFITEQYAQDLPMGCMLGYAIEGDLACADQRVSAAIAMRRLARSAGRPRLRPLARTYDSRRTTDAPAAARLICGTLF